MKRTFVVIPREIGVDEEQKNKAGPLSSLRAGPRCACDVVSIRSTWTWDFEHSAATVSALDGATTAHAATTHRDQVHGQGFHAISAGVRRNVEVCYWFARSATSAATSRTFGA